MAANELEPKLERMTPKTAEEFEPELITAKNGKAMKVYYESQRLMDLVHEYPDDFHLGLDAVAEEHPEAIILVTEDGVRVIRPEGEQRAKEVLANRLFTASTQDPKHVYVRALKLCRHCAKLYCDVRKPGEEYVGELPIKITEVEMMQALAFQDQEVSREIMATLPPEIKRAMEALGMDFEVRTAIPRPRSRGQD